jgi:hypothetical protein
MAAKIIGEERNIVAKRSKQWRHRERNENEKMAENGDKRRKAYENHRKQATRRRK